MERETWIHVHEEFPLISLRVIQVHLGPCPAKNLVFHDTGLYVAGFMSVSIGILDHYTCFCLCLE